MIIISPLLSSLCDPSASSDKRFLPAADQVRPTSCPACGALAYRPGKPLGVVAHGSYVRKVRGIGNSGEVISLRVRRFRCRNCNGTISVLPDLLHPRRRYAAKAVFDALLRHLVDRQPARKVRHQFTGSRSRRTSWRSLLRWRRDLLYRLWGWLGARLGAQGPARTRREGRRRLIGLAAEKGLLDRESHVDLTLAGTVHAGNWSWRFGQAPPGQLQARVHGHSCAAPSTLDVRPSGESSVVDPIDGETKARRRLRLRL